MFLDKERGKEEEIRKPGFGQEPESARIFSYKNIIIGAIVIILVLIMVAIVIVVIFKGPATTLPPESGNISQITSSPTSTLANGKLPGDLGNGRINGFEFGTSTENIKAEDLTFGHFYQKEEDDFKSTIESFDLPINIKVEAANYYDVSRKINLDAQVENINNKGFVILDNQFPVQDDFFAMYRFLLAKEIPIVVTTDFLFYYYQNTLKQVFKEIEKNAFYENVWDINKRLFIIALTRYKKRSSEVGLVNDPILEASRLEAAYLAVALKLLAPTEEQINRKANFSDESKFNPQEADFFSFEMPDYLQEDVDKEVGLIRKAGDITKSPVMLYEKDYKFFNVPDNYKNNAKLNNFYLTLKWLNSVFPLYYKSESCLDCSLDHDDWLINIAAAGYIAKDLFDNQDIKNQWAIIYKFISFFSGLRQDLTYLHYHYALLDLFGESYAIEDIFSSQNIEREEDLSLIQKKIADFRFSAMEGSFNRNNELFKPDIGMRILQESYWPNDYIFSQLTGIDMQSKEELENENKNITACEDKMGHFTYRCLGFGLDIINLLDSFTGGSDYFINNTNYHNYHARVNELREQIDKFNIYTWNNNIYWVTLDIIKSLLNYKRSSLPVFTRTDSWQQTKAVNTALGAWVNLHLPEDSNVNYFEQKGSNLGMYSECNPYNYIEPNIDFIQELIAKNNMLINMLAALRVTESTHAASTELKELNNKLQTVLSISKKELSNEQINNEDCKSINDLISHYLVEKKGDKTFTINFANKNLTESIEGVKLLVVVYKNGDKKIMAVGPVFNYKEK